MSAWVKRQGAQNSNDTTEREAGGRTSKTRKKGTHSHRPEQAKVHTGRKLCNSARTSSRVTRCAKNGTKVSSVRCFRNPAGSVRRKGQCEGKKHGHGKTSRGRAEKRKRSQDCIRLYPIPLHSNSSPRPQQRNQRTLPLGHAPVEVEVKTKTRERYLPWRAVPGNGGYETPQRRQQRTTTVGNDNRGVASISIHNCHLQERKTPAEQTRIPHRVREGPHLVVCHEPQEGQGTSRIRRYLETSQPSGLCRDASSNMAAFRESPAGTRARLFPSVSTLRGLTCCSKEHTFWNNPAESQDSRRFRAYANAPRERQSPRKPFQSFGKGWTRPSGAPMNLKIRADLQSYV